MARWLKRWFGSGKRAIKFLMLAVVPAAVGAIVTLVINQLSEGPPYRVTVQSNPDQITIPTGSAGDAQGYVVTDKTIGEIPPPPNATNTCSGRYRWAKRRLNAIDADGTTIRIRLDGRTDLPVHILNVEVQMVASRPAPTEGLHLTCPGQGALPDIRTLNVDLDQPAPRAAAMDSSGNAIPVAFTVKKGESETFDLNAHTNNCDCEWKVVLSMEHDGEKFTEERGPFRTRFIAPIAVV
jgi:hypothetical protein